MATSMVATKFEELFDSLQLRKEIITETGHSLGGHL